MKKKLIEKYNIELKNKKIPLIIHYAISKNIHFEDEANIRKINNDLSHIYIRYNTVKYIPGNKFYKPISRILNV